MISFQSRIHIYRINFFYIKFLYKLIISKLFKINSDISNLEDTLKNRFRSKHAHLVGQCREGIYYAVKYSILKTNKREVIVSSYTLYHVINMIISAGGIPIFIDLEKNTLRNNYKEILKATNNNTACVILTHLFDVNNEITNIKQYLSSKNIFLIEDCAVAHGIKNSKNIETGQFGDFGILSFQAMKNVQSLMGGAIITNNDDFSKWIKIKTHKLDIISTRTILNKLIFVFCIDFLTKTKFINFAFFQILKLAYKKNINFILKLIRADHLPDFKLKDPLYYFKNMTNVQAEFINIGLKSMDYDCQERLKNAKIYYDHFKKFKNVIILSNENFYNINHLEFPILCKHKDELFNYLLKKNIDVRKFYYRDLGSLNCYKNFKKTCKNAEEIESKILTLPCYPKYSIKNINKNIDAIKEFYYQKN